jgi:hypothetical protein
LIERLVGDGTVVARSDGSVHNLFPIAITVAEGEALRSWAAREGATRTIEVGLGYGSSALFIGEALVSSGDGMSHWTRTKTRASPVAVCRFSTKGALESS